MYPSHSINNNIIKYVILLVLCVTAPALGTHAQTTLELADSAYNAEDYRQAIRLYQQAINQSGVSAQVYYNLGNAYYRIDNLGRSILCYRRALNIDPSMADARANLGFVETKVLDRPEDDSSFLDNLHRSILASTTPNRWAWIALISFVALLGCVGMYIFSHNVTMRKTGFFGGFVVFLLTIYFMIIASQSSSALYDSRYAVIMVPSSNLRSQPGNNTDQSDRVISLHEGTVVEIIDSITMPGESTAPKWYHVKLNNSTRAWINAADVEKI